VVIPTTPTSDDRGATLPASAAFPRLLRAARCVIAPPSRGLPILAVTRATQHAPNTEPALVTTFAHRGIPLVAGAMLAALAGCTKKEAAASLVTTAAVERRDIVVEAEATGSVEPVDTVAVKSIAGGLVLRMPVEVGSAVKPGDLLVQIDTRDLRNQSEQARANLVAAQAQLTVAAAARERAERLGAARIITAAERESATATFASAQSAVVTRRTNVDIARQRLDDATVRAQVAGTVISKPVSVGTVITSATASASGGTTLLTIADLSRVRMRALVNETDIGSVQVGQPATVTVDAFPDRRFTGTVEKIEPQAVVEQSVTMFPVLVSLQNPSGSLLPGMNGEITMRVQERTDVIAVPNDAVRSVRDMATAAQALGLSADSVRALMQAQAAAGPPRGGGPGRDVGQTVAVTDSPARPSPPRSRGRRGCSRRSTACGSRCAPARSRWPTCARGPGRSTRAPAWSRAPRSACQRRRTAGGAGGAAAGRAGAAGEAGAAGAAVAAGRDGAAGGAGRRAGRAAAWSSSATAAAGRRGSCRSASATSTTPRCAATCAPGSRSRCSARPSSRPSASSRTTASGAPPPARSAAAGPPARGAAAGVAVARGRGGPR
jgi:HlyD family secretion protein